MIVLPEALFIAEITHGNVRFQRSHLYATADGNQSANRPLQLPQCSVMEHNSIQMHQAVTGTAETHPRNGNF